MPHPNIGIQLLFEFIGTFLLCCAANSGTPQAAPVTLIAIIFAFGALSQAHYNPIVSLAFCFFGRKPVHMIFYTIIQLVAGLLSAVIMNVAKFSMKAFKLPDPPQPDTNQLILMSGAELFGSFFLVIVIINVAILQSENHYFGLAIAAAVLGAAGITKDIGPQVFNPAVLLSLMSLGKLAWSVSVTIIAQTVGALLAVICGKLAQTSQKEKQRNGRDYDDDDEYTSCLLRCAPAEETSSEQPFAVNT